MVKLPLLTARELSNVLETAGFKRVRQKGSHVFFRHPDGRTTIVPNNPGEKLDRSLLDKIIKKDMMLSREEFMKLMPR